MGFQISPITHSYINNYLFNLTYFLQEITNALYTYHIIQLSSEEPEKPAWFYRGRRECQKVIS